MSLYRRFRTEKSDEAELYCACDRNVERENRFATNTASWINREYGCRDINIFSVQRMACFMSYGMGNRFGHPSQYLVDMLETKFDEVIEVTQQNRYVEMIEIG